jgi:hypothetical protein
MKHPHCDRHHDPLDGDSIQHLKKMLDYCVDRGDWFEISDCSAYDLREYIRKLEEIVGMKALGVLTPSHDGPILTF